MSFYNSIHSSIGFVLTSIAINVESLLKINSNLYCNFKYLSFFYKFFKLNILIDKMGVLSRRIHLILGAGKTRISRKSNFYSTYLFICCCFSFN